MTRSIAHGFSLSGVLGREAAGPERTTVGAGATVLSRESRVGVDGDLDGGME
jgi:hypothetical protein